MKLTAYTYNRVWGAWDDVETWVVSGPMLTMFLVKAKGRREAESIALPAEVVGLADDSPPRPPADHWSDRPPKPVTSGLRPTQVPPRERPSQKGKRRW